MFPKVVPFSSATIAVLALALLPGQALASGCPATTQSQPFSSFGDSNWYQLAPGGDFEGSMSGWTLTGGAKTVAGSESYGATGKVGKYSLSLPPGASATSPYVCVDPSYRTLRFFARSESSSSGVSVQVLYKTPSGPYAIPVGSVTPGKSWAPSAQMPTYAGPASATSGGVAYVAVRLSSNSGSAGVDDVFIDPRHH